MSVSSFLYFCFIQVPVDLFISVGSFSSYKSFSLLNFVVLLWELFSFSHGKTTIFKRLVYLQVLRIKQRISGSLEFLVFSEVFPNFSVLLKFLVFPGRGLNVCGRLNRPAMPNCHMHCYGHRFIS